MGFIKKGLLILVCVLLLGIIVVGNMFWTLSASLDYDVLKPELEKVVKEIVDKEVNFSSEDGGEYSMMIQRCVNNSEHIFNEEDLDFDIVVPCDVVAEGPDAVVSLFVSDIYYREYDCDFWECFNEGDVSSYFVFVSQKAKSYWNSWLFSLFVISVFLILIMFFLVEKKSNLCFIVGFLVILAALPFLSMKWIYAFVSSVGVLDSLSVFFIKSSSVFVRGIIFGIVLLLFGLGLKFFGIGIKINEFFSRFKSSKEVEAKPVKKIVVKKEAKEIKTLEKKDNNVQSLRDKTGL